MATSNNENTDKRAEYVAGLRALADVIEANPHLVLPLRETFAAFCATREQLQDWLRVLPGEKHKKPNSDETYMTVGSDGGVFGPHGFKAWITRDEVCERVVTGTRTVTKSVPTGFDTVTETEDVVEWVCAPLLAEATS